MTNKPVRSLALATWGLLSREILRFSRQPGRIAGAIGTPIMFWFVLGSGFGNSLRPPGISEIDYLTFFHPGAMLMILLFTTIFSSISVIQDRTSGFLSAILVTQAPRLAIVLGKVLSSTILGTLQSATLLLAAPLLGIQLTLAGVTLCFGILTLTSLGLSSLGFAFAWHMRSIQSFHGIMNLLLFPMWMLSGAFFSHTSATQPILTLMWGNPLTYALSALRYAILPIQQSQALMIVSPLNSLIILIFFCVGSLVWALFSVFQSR